MLLFDIYVPNIFYSYLREYIGKEIYYNKNLINNIELTVNIFITIKS